MSTTAAPIITPDDLAADALALIAADAATDPDVAACRSFAALHDLRDANMYIDDAHTDSGGTWETFSDVADLYNAAAAIVDQAMRRGDHDPRQTPAAAS